MLSPTPKVMVTIPESIGFETTAGVTLSSRPISSSLLLCIRGLIFEGDFLEPKILRKKLPIDAPF